MAIYTDPPEWEAKGKKPPSSKRTEGWRPGDRVPASWLNWFWNRVSKSLQEIQQAVINHRDASAPHDGHETKVGANQKIQTHSDKTTGVHGVSAGFHVATTSRADQRVGWGDVVEKPDVFPPSSHDHDGRYYTKAQVEALLAEVSPTWMVPGDTLLASISSSGLIEMSFGRNIALAGFYVKNPGRYRVRFKMDTLRAPVYVWLGLPGGINLSSRVYVSTITSDYTLNCTNGHVPGGGMVCLYFYPATSVSPIIALDWARLYGVPGSPPPEYQGVHVPNWAS